MAQNQTRVPLDWIEAAIKCIEYDQIEPCVELRIQFADWLAQHPEAPVYERFKAQTAWGVLNEAIEALEPMADVA